MTKLSYQEASELAKALQDIVDYLTDNSCGDPDCCYPYSSYEAYKDGCIELKKYNLDVTHD